MVDSACGHGVGVEIGGGRGGFTVKKLKTRTQPYVGDVSKHKFMVSIYKLKSAQFNTVSYCDLLMPSCRTSLGQRHLGCFLPGLNL
jgi:hypothetical protein